ncbi:MAG: hypothetical protein AAB787_01615 [Patescibacteria group bacterium]
MKTEPYNRTGHLQEQIEEILKVVPLMPREILLLTYMKCHTSFTEKQMLNFLAMLHMVPVDSILRYARKYRQKLGIRDEVRQGLAEQERRYWPEQKNLEANPPFVCHCGEELYEEDSTCPACKRKGAVYPKAEPHHEDCDCFPCGQKADIFHENLLDMIAGGN